MRLSFLAKSRNDKQIRKEFWPESMTGNGQQFRMVIGRHSTKKNAYQCIKRTDSDQVCLNRKKNNNIFQESQEQWYGQFYRIALDNKSKVYATGIELVVGTGVDPYG